MHNVDELKQRLVHVRHGVGQTIIDDAIMTSSIAVFVIVCGRRVDTLNKCCDNIKRLFIQPCDIKRFIYVNIYDLQSSFL